ncbi:MerR family transcriptional regulator [Streptomonospora wellingtoniae]|uniref:MerR family transcriptional regulator n=1 Tax=Streptomonospora wellingtoniae TaxID=3075544 RepID=A0ABU2KYG9_9ACTN|nr:MerR family transcriptional regulator [Streptomonospora sp. DSM 45055]MDT0304305.1 MerR family transcriptional regulator [Streptomonospora sp. DSM 45055]
MSKANAADAGRLRVGDLSARTGVSPRLLRYYENQGLLSAERSATGQRLFAPAAAEHVRYIRMLLAAGLPTRVIGELLGCIHDPGRLEPCAVPVLVEHLREHDERIAELLGTHEALQGLIDSSAPPAG